MSDHYPLWMQINTDIEGEQLDEIIKAGSELTPFPLRRRLPRMVHSKGEEREKVTHRSHCAGVRLAGAARAGALVDVSVVNRSTGERIPVYAHRGRIHVPGTPGRSTRC